MNEVRKCPWGASLAFDKSAVTKEYKEEIDKLKKAKDATSKKLGEVIVERDFVMEKLESLVSSNIRGRSIDNIVIERFWRSLKYDNVYPSSYTNIKEARIGIDEYINTYNKERLHSALDYLTPNEAYYNGANNKCFDTKSVLLRVA